MQIYIHGEVSSSLLIDGFFYSSFKPSVSSGQDVYIVAFCTLTSSQLQIKLTHHDSSENWIVSYQTFKKVGTLCEHVKIKPERSHLQTNFVY